MRNFLVLILIVTSSRVYAAKATSSDVCANNFLAMIDAVSKDTSGKYKKIIFTYDADKQLQAMAEELLKLGNPVDSPEALAIFKKAKPILIKEGPKVFNLCIKYTDAMKKQLAKICPNVIDYNKECNDGASSHPSVFKVMVESEKAIKELVMAKTSYKPTLPQ